VCVEYTTILGHRTDTGVFVPLCSIRLNCQAMTRLECVLLDMLMFIAIQAAVRQGVSNRDEGNGHL